MLVTVNYAIIRAVSTFDGYHSAVEVEITVTLACIDPIGNDYKVTIDSGIDGGLNSWILSWY